MFETQWRFAVSYDSTGRLTYLCEMCGASEDGGGVWPERMKAHLSESHGRAATDLERQDVTRDGKLVEVLFGFERPE
jgi:hypothetical protein